MKTRLEKSKHQKKEEQKETGRQKLKRLKRGTCVWNPKVQGTYTCDENHHERGNIGLGRKAQQKKRKK
jgi:hypothetical protein